MPAPLQFPGEDRSNALRDTLARTEPRAMRTFTPTQAVLAKSAGCFHWTPEGRRLYDFSSGVLVANLGHNPRSWLRRLAGYLHWSPAFFAETANDPDHDDSYCPAVPLTAYNAITPVEMQAVERLLASLQRTAYGDRLDQVCWAASGSEAVQKALWACLQPDPRRGLILATRHGFHGKKGLAGAVTGTEYDPDRDPRVLFIDFPRQEIDDLPKQAGGLDLEPYLAEFQRLWGEHGDRIVCLITEPYLGGGGSFHPPSSYLRMLADFCRQRGILFVLDEVQSNFGRTGAMYAFEKHGIAPDLVCLGKGLGNGIPVAAVAGRSDVLSRLGYGAASDTWSAAPIACAAVLATLDAFETEPVLEHAGRISELVAAGLTRCQQTGLIAKVRGEGMVFGIECGSVGNLSAEAVAAAVVEACYLGETDGDGIHLLGPLAGKVLRISPPLTITEAEANASLDLMYRLLSRLAVKLAQAAGSAPEPATASVAT